MVGYIEQTGDYQWKFNDVKSKEELSSIINELANDPLLISAESNYITETVGEDFNVGVRWNSNTS